jgi:hypothetical protein
MFAIRFYYCTVIQKDKYGIKINLAAIAGLGRWQASVCCFLEHPTITAEDRRMDEGGVMPAPANRKFQNEAGGENRNESKESVFQSFSQSVAIKIQHRHVNRTSRWTNK